MSNIWGDPQFYIVTAVAAWGVWAIVKPVLSSSKDPEGGCPTCSSCPKSSPASGPFQASGPRAESSKDSTPLVVLGNGHSSSSRR